MSLTKLMASCGPLLLILYLSSDAKASYILNVNQAGSDVVAMGSGSLNTSGLGNGGSGIISPQVWPSFQSGCCFSPISLIAVGAIGFDSVFNGFIVGSPIMGSGNFGSGPQINASAGSGSTVELIANAYIGVPVGYLSGSGLGTSTATWQSQTLASLGLIPGTYTYTWGSGASADSFTWNIAAQPTSTPEPSSSCLVIVGTLGLSLIGLRRMGSSRKVSERNLSTRARQ